MLDVPGEAAGERLDRFIADHLGSRAAAERAVERGATVDGQLRPKSYRLEGGEELELTVPEREETGLEREEVPLRIAWEDEHVLVVDKPAGVVVHPSPGHASGTLVHGLVGLAAGGEDEERPGIVHRLDRDTSGLLVVARSAEAHRRLKHALQAREITRGYVALVEGRPPARTGTIEAPIGRDRRVRTRMSTDTDAPRDAVTHFAVAEALPRTTLLDVRLETGRTHQIRVHLEAIGHPVVGDPEYGTAGRLGLGRQFLHAARLAFAQPFTGASIDVDSPLPDDLVAALDRARAESG